MASAILIAALLSGSGLYAALLTNWFRYPVSLEATFVLIILAFGMLAAAVLALLASIKQSRRRLIAGFAVAIATAAAVIAAQFQAFGQLPSWSLNHVVKSPVGKVAISQESVEYWLQLENPFARSHSEYLIVRGRSGETRVPIPIFEGPAPAYAQPLVAEDWARLTPTADPSVVELEIGPNLIRKGRFRVDLRTGHAERIL